MSADALAQSIDTIASLIEAGDFGNAERRAQAALQSLPAHAELWRLLAIAQLKAGKTESAVRALQQARRLDPHSIEVLCNLASVEILVGHAVDARRTLEQALALAPNHVGALNNLGRVRYRLGDYEGAAQCFERSLRAQPGAPAPWIDLANVRIAQYRFDVAEDHLRYALALQPNSADGWYLMGYLCERISRWQDAIAAYERSLAVQPRPQTAHNLGLIYDHVSDWPAAVRAMQLALKLDPGMIEAAAQLAFYKRKLCDWDDAEALGQRLLQAVDQGATGITPFSFLAEASSPQQQLHCAKLFARQFAAAASQAHPASAVAAGPLRVGFVSSGFNQHATGLLVVELIEQLRALPVQTIAFATTRGDATPLRQRLEAAFDEFHLVAQRPVAETATRIRDARVDILIDVDGYCMGSLPQLFAQRAAPVQINWLAYPGTLGAPWYDYIIADRFLIPEAQRDCYAEKVACLPRCYQPTDTTRSVPPPPDRTACDLPSEGFVYCCFNNNWKYTAQRFALWMRILDGAPGSVLWLLDGVPGNGASDRLRAQAQRAGIDPGRLVFCAKMSHPEYLARLGLADLFLDTAPYGAHTTASDAIYAGCPVLTLPGPTFASRVAGSLNTQLGLNELIVERDEDYVARAIELAQHPAQLDALRLRLRDPATRARLFDMRAYAEDFLELLQRIAERSRRGEAPAEIRIAR